MNSKKVIFLTRSLGLGGAERQLVALAKGLHERGHSVAVITFYSDGPLESDLFRAGVSVILLRKSHRWDVFAFLWRLVRALQRETPDILHGYQGVPNLVTIALKPIFPRVRMVWGVRASYMDLSQYDWLARLVYRAECLFSRFADLVIFNSKAGHDYHVRNGFRCRTMVVVPNGIDTEQFRPDSESRQRLRTEWGIQAGEKLIGLVARFDPMKDHPVFLHAAALVARNISDARFVFVGSGPQSYQLELCSLAKKLSLQDKIVWAGPRNDMRAVYNALDILALSSYGEGFPNVVAESMACGTPCVVTEVGDCVWIIGDSGISVPPRDADALAKGLITGLRGDLRELGRRARSRIEDKFDQRYMLDTTEAVLWPQV